MDITEPKNITCTKRVYQICIKYHRVCTEQYIPFGHLTSKTVPVLPSLDPSILFPFYLLPSPVHPTRFSFCFFPGFFAIFILLSSNNILIHAEILKRSFNRILIEHSATAFHILGELHCMDSDCLCHCKLTHSRVVF